MAIVTHKNNRSIWLFDYTQLEPLSDCQSKMVCLSDRDISIIWNAIQNISLIKSRVFLSAEGQQYTIVDDTQFEVFQQWVATMRNNLGGWAMCNEQLEAIKDVLQELVDKPCCPAAPGGGSAGAGIEEAGVSSQGSSGTDREGPPPPGFESWEEYDNYKCDMAHHIITQMKGDIATAGLLAALYTGGPALASALIAAIFTPVGWAVLIGLAGLAISWFLLGAEVSLLTGFLEEKRDELVCALLAGDDAASSITEYSDAVDSLIPAYTEISSLGSVAEYLAINYLKGWLTVDSSNRLYDKVAYAIETGNTCTCGEISPWTVVYGTTSSTSPDPEIIGEGVFESGYGCGAEARHFGVSFAQPAKIILFTVDGGVPSNCMGADIYYYYANDDFTDLIESGNTPPQVSNAVGIRSMYVLWDSTSHDDDVVLEQGPY